MYLCYVDESGTPSIPGNTSHYVLAGLAIPADQWKRCDGAVQAVKGCYGLVDEEVHVAWMLRKYSEQAKIPGFASMSQEQRRAEVRRFRTAELLRLQRISQGAQYRQTKKNYDKTSAYVHLTYDERRSLVLDIAGELAGWTDARLFAECIDKVHFDPVRSQTTVEDQAFEQVVTRFETYLQAISSGATRNRIGLLIHDNNETVAKRHAALMKRFHADGTKWQTLERVIETPLFVDSGLTGMVQVADLCCYALRRYLENQERDIFDLVLRRAGRGPGLAAGVRHCAQAACLCEICAPSGT